MEFRTLGRTGLEVSKLGFGGSPLGNEFGETDPLEAERAVHCAIDLGINYFDVAPYYGRTLAETRLGTALKGRRDKVILATKCGRYDVAKFDFSAARIRASIDESLARLRTDYLDIFLAHDIEFVSAKQIVEETIPTMRALQNEGKTRFIGITGLQLNMLRKVAEAAPVDVILSYCRYNLLITDLDDLLTPFVQNREIGLMNASPLHMGLLTQNGPPPWHPASPEVKEVARVLVEFFAKSGVRITDLALQFCLQHPTVATTLAGMSTVEQVRENVAAAHAPADATLINEARDFIGPFLNRSWPTGLLENHDAS
ncbi:MAG TPA: aldo/keto reductase [Bryobacteraceae bacterium]|jgi:L-galactose dehydrogenase|nr:aldo/keto reductase [Bryobacteraceae bacterium]